MEREDLLSHAESCAADALALMAGRGVPPTPRNFTLFYHLYSGEHPDVRLALEARLDSAAAINDIELAELYDQFFTTNQETQVVSEAASRIETAMASILEHLMTASHEMAAFGSMLSDVSSRVETISDANDLRGLIEEVVSATRNMAQRNRSLEQRLNQSAEEIHGLKADLDSMRREALTDSLTGLSNRKAFDLELHRVALDSLEKDHTFALLMIDIDHFKKFNDSYGHQVGDQVLRLLGATLKASIKGSDTAVRYGGEEFCVILPNTHLPDGATVGEHIREAVANKTVLNRKTGQVLGRITVSVGVAAYRRDEALASLIARADEALYLAKRTGRDRVATETDLDAATGQIELVVDGVSQPE